MFFNNASNASQLHLLTFLYTVELYFEHSVQLLPSTQTIVILRLISDGGLGGAENKEWSREKE